MLKIRQAEYDEIRRHGEEAYPEECCGVLLGTSNGRVRTVDQVARCTNTRTDYPQTRYNIDPVELVRIQREARERELTIVGFYHSHPDHSAHWSQTDFAEAHWIGCSYVITSVLTGKAAVTQSFALTGTVEEDKALVREDLILK